MARELFPDFQVILVPGLHGSGPGHWQSLWQRSHPGWHRVVQDDWSDPDLPAWSAKVDEARAADPRPALFIAHSFGCLATVHSIAADPENVAAALLVAPADPDKFGVAQLLPSQPLVCPTLLISSADDPWMPAGQARLWARRWGSDLLAAGALGHINAESGLGDWPQGREALHLLYDRAHNDHPATSA